MLGAYITYTLFTYLKIDPFLTLPVSMIVLYFIGYASQKYLLNYIIRASIFITLTFTFGLQILIANVALLIWTANFKSVAPAYSGEGIVLGGLVFPLHSVRHIYRCFNSYLSLLSSDDKNKDG